MSNLISIDCEASKNTDNNNGKNKYLENILHNTITSTFKKENIMEGFNFKVDIGKCNGCGRCIKTCSSAILKLDENHHPKMEEGVDGIVGWRSCYRCQHCLAVCPNGAISIFNRDPEDSFLPCESANVWQLEALMRNRRAYRRYKDQEVPREVIVEMLQLLENIPTGSNNQTIDFNVVYK